MSKSRLMGDLVPRISDFVVDCSFYVYESEADAQEGSRSGGCGFLAHVTSTANPKLGHIYAVTCRHLLDNDCGVLRLNRKHGGFDIITTKYSDWITHPDGDDVAVFPIDMPDESLNQLKWWSVPSEMFLTRELIDAYHIGIGDEVFLVGRLMSHDGRQKNSPVLRFGNLSLMADPDEPISVEVGMDQRRDQEGFLVESRSLSGFSGSPVFVETRQVYRGDRVMKVHALEVEQRKKEMMHRGETVIPPGQPLGLTLTPVSMEGIWGPWLLGIDWGHMPLYRSVERNGIEDRTLRINLNTGIACVLPGRLWRF